MGPLVREAFELYATGRYTLDALLLAVRARGLRTPRGSQLPLSALSNLLRNGFYIGLIVWKGTEVHQGAHERLIPVHLFARVQQLLHARVRQKVECNDFRYRRQFRCGSCKRTLTGELQKGHVYYRCHGADCPGTCVREETIEEAVRSTYRRIAMTKEQLGRLGDYVAAFAAESSGSSDDHDELQLAALKQRHDRLVDAYVDGNIDQATFAGRKERLLIEQATLDERRSMSTDCDVLAKRDALVFELAGSALLSHEKASDAEKRQLLQMLTSNRLVNGKEAVVELRFPFEQLSHDEDISHCGEFRGTLRTGKVRSKRVDSKRRVAIPRQLRHVIRKITDWIREHHDELPTKLAPELPL